MEEDLKQTILELQARIEALENKAVAPKDEMSPLRKRLREEREARIEKKEVESFQRKEGERTGPRPTGQHRREELTRRTQTVIPAPVVDPPRQVAAAAAQAEQAASGTPIDFYCWKDGQVAVVKVLCDGEPSILTS